MPKSVSDSFAQRETHSFPCHLHPSGHPVSHVAAYARAHFAAHTDSDAYTEARRHCCTDRDPYSRLNSYAYASSAAARVRCA